MSTASRPLSQELYTLSGWDATYRRWVPGLGHAANPDEAQRNRYKEDPNFPSAPAYDLGMLLRMLADEENLAKLALCRCEHQDGSRNWGIEVQDQSNVFGPKIFAYADSPEDAAATLAIDLFKQGILGERA